MKIKFIAPSGKTLQQKISVLLKSAEKEVEANVSLEQIEDRLRHSIQSIANKCFLIEG